MFRTVDPQESFFGNWVYNRVVSPDHFLRKLAAVVDFAFVNDLVHDCYEDPSAGGRPGWEPQLLFKVLFLAYLDNVSEREIEEAVNVNLTYKWFLGLAVDQKGPDRTTLGVFRDRLGAERFAVIFNQVVTMARDQKLVSDKLHLTDATAVRAKVDLFRLAKEHKKDDHDKTYVDKNTPDPDAKFGRKSNKPTGGFYGYKAHMTMDADSEIVTSLEVTPGNAQDCTVLPALLAPPYPDRQVADKGYDYPPVHRALRQRGIHSGIIRKAFAGRRLSKVMQKKRSQVRAPVEHKIAEGKRYHGLQACRYWGLTKTRLQAFLVGIVVNLKRMVRLMHDWAKPPWVMAQG
jgi:transposase, IS5 family